MRLRTANNRQRAKMRGKSVYRMVTFGRIGAYTAYRRCRPRKHPKEKCSGCGMWIENVWLKEGQCPSCY